MKILAVARTLPFHSIGGMQSIAWDLLRSFARMGHHVDVITTRIPNHTEPFHSEGVHVRPVSAGRAERCDGAWQKAARVMATRLDCPDVLFSVSSAGSCLAGFWPGVPAVFQAHGTSWGEFESKIRSRRLAQVIKSPMNLYGYIKDALIYHRFDHIALVGDILESQFSSAPTAWIARDIERSIIRNGVDTAQFRPDEGLRSQTRAAFGLTAEDHVVVFAARLHAQKGALKALSIFSRLASEQPRSRLLIVGAGEEEARIAQYIQEQGLKRLVQCTGAVSRAEMPSLLNAGDVFVFPSLRQEGLPMNVLEALACGLPCLCSMSMSGLFDPSLPIRYLDVSDEPSWIATIRDLQARPLRPSEFQAINAYGMDECARRYSELFENLRSPT